MWTNAELTEVRCANTELNTRRLKSLNQIAMEMDLSWVEKKHKDYRIAHTLADVDYIADSIRKAGFYGFDTEGTGTMIHNLSNDNPAHDSLVGMSFSWKRNQGIYIPLEHIGMKNLDGREVFKRLKPIFEKVPCTGHHLLYDGEMLYRHGVKLNIAHDTHILLFNLDSRISKNGRGLKESIQRIYGYSPIEMTDMFVGQVDYGMFKYVEEDLARIYACADADHALSLLMDRLPELQPFQYKSYLGDIEILKELIRIDYEGKGVDLKLCSTLHDVTLADIATIKNIIFNYVGCKLAHNYGTAEEKKNYNLRYTWNLNSEEETAHVLFDLLGYPIQSVRDSGGPAVDKYVLKALFDVNAINPDPLWEKLVPNDIESGIINCGFDWVTSEDSEFIKTKEFRQKKYLVAGLISLYRDKEKNRSSFFAPILSNNYEHKYFTNISMTAAETARIIDPIQTLKGPLKRIITAFDPENEYVFGYDYHQIEYREMIGEAHLKTLMDLLENWEKDYHREGGSLFLRKKPWLITDSERSQIKSVHFAVPYGTSAMGIAKRRLGPGASKEELAALEKVFKELIKLWKDNLPELWNLLESWRDSAFIEVPDDELPRELKGQKIGRIVNRNGRLRYFDLSNMTTTRMGSIRRMTGNFPIQSVSRDTFCNGWVALSRQAVKDGLMDILTPDENSYTGYTFTNLIRIMALIHDEVLACVNRKVNYKYIYKLVQERAVQHVEGYPTFYCACCIVDNWHEAHGMKEYEAPVPFIAEEVAGDFDIFVEPDKHLKEHVLEKIRAYKRRRVAEEIKTITGKTGNFGVIDIESIASKLTNYTVADMLKEIYPPRRKFDKAMLEPFSDRILACLETYFGLEYPGTIATYASTGKAMTLTADKSVPCETVHVEKEHDEEEFVDSDVDYDSVGDVSELNTDNFEYAMKILQTTLYGS